MELTEFMWLDSSMWLVTSFYDGMRSLTKFEEKESDPVSQIERRSFNSIKHPSNPNES